MKRYLFLILIFLVVGGNALALTSDEEQAIADAQYLRNQADETLRVEKKILKELKEAREEREEEANERDR